jgi:hypothetical protein
MRSSEIYEWYDGLGEFKYSRLCMDLLFRVLRHIPLDIHDA